MKSAIARSALGVSLLFAAALARADAGRAFEEFKLPAEWERRFWEDSGAKALLKLSPKAVADLIPTQAGFRYCRCPNCDSSETSDTLEWAATDPSRLTCRSCGIKIPNDAFPAKVDGKIPEESIEVVRGTVHKYPYHLVPAERQRYPDERVYILAKRDYEAREFLSKAALYAAVRYRNHDASRRDPALARLSAVILVGFARAYPKYAAHLDQPGRPKSFQTADLPPPYRRGYETGKWDRLGNLNVPLNLVVAYALIRDDPAFLEVGKLLGVPEPSRIVERDLLRASAEFSRDQTEEYDERSIHVYRGLLAVGRVLDDDELVREARTRFQEFTRRGFFHDGFWRHADFAAHRRVMSMLDSWVDSLEGDSDEEGRGSPILSLARAADGLRNREAEDVALTSLNSVDRTGPILFGGAGIARLQSGGGAGSIEIEIRDTADSGARLSPRQALRLGVGGRTVLGDLDEAPPTSTGWELSTASHCTVLVDGLNQRESPERARRPRPGGNPIYFAADPGFQAAAFDDNHAYPRLTQRYRQTIAISAGKRSRYALSIFEARGGRTHDQIFHAAAGNRSQWRLPILTKPLRGGLLDSGVKFEPDARPEDGRWFVQAYGEFQDVRNGRADGPITAELIDESGQGTRLHLLGDPPSAMITGKSPDPTSVVHGRDGRSSLIARRSSTTGAALRSTFVTVFEPIGPGFGRIRRAGRVASNPNFVVLYIETEDSQEHLVINLEPGSAGEVVLADGRRLVTDGLAVKISGEELYLAGGTFAKSPSREVRAGRVSGRVLKVGRDPQNASGGWFEVDGIPISTNLGELSGRTLLIRHGNGLTRGWRITDLKREEKHTVRIHVREAPGFEIDQNRGEAVYHQFPRTVEPGPHLFSVCRLTR